ncbi:hypothetical protein [Hasllibacter sp. MH4015]|uniref:hypothetical protein n=1 Tax=Hasllibacter sp. MH4015 TaxID=2854029 RepID=UPI001CD65D15|nr:hypothetical protein [Hasllibacter sp. MH4015]
MGRFSMLRQVLLSMALVFTVLPASAHEVRPTIADIEVGQTQMTMSMRVTLEALIAGIDLTAVGNTDDAPEAQIYDQLRALEPDALEAALREAWPRISEGFIVQSGGTRAPTEILSVQIPPVGDEELPRDSMLTIGADLPDGDAGVQVGLAPQFGTFVPRQTGGGEEAYEGFLFGGELTPELQRQSGGAGDGGFAVGQYAALAAGLVLALVAIWVIRRRRAP